jgi:probable rRNA maturation factor
MDNDDPDPHSWVVAVRRAGRFSGLSRGLVQRAVRRTLSMESVPPCEVSVLLTDDAGLRALNAEWRGLDEATDVLSFPHWALTPGSPTLDDRFGLPCLGDLAISLPTAQRQSHDLDAPLDEVVAHLIVHGVLHLLGYDHGTRPEKRAMRSRETTILAALGFSPVVWKDRAHAAATR